MSQPSATVAGVTTVQRETFHYTPATGTAQFPQESKMGTASTQSSFVYGTTSCNDTGEVTLGSQNAGHLDPALVRLQEQLESMKMQQQSLETRITTANKMQFSMLEHQVQLQINESLRDSEIRQNEKSTADNAALQAEMTKNKQTASNEMSETMKFLQVLHQNAVSTQAKNESFQTTVMARLAGTNAQVPPTQPMPQQENKEKQLAHNNTKTSTQTGDKRIGETPEPPGDTTTTSTTPFTPSPITRSLSSKRPTQQSKQQSILATMAKIGPQNKQVGTDTVKSRPGTDHGNAGIDPQPDNSHHGSTHRT